MWLAASLIFRFVGLPL